MKTSNTPLNRILRQTQLLGLVLLSWCWAASAQTQLALVDFNDDAATYSTNFNLVENGSPVAFWSSNVGLTNSGGLSPGTGAAPPEFTPISPSISPPPAANTFLPCGANIAAHLPAPAAAGPW